MTEKLSPRQEQVLALLATDMNRPQIAAALGVTLSVVTQVCSYLRKKGYDIPLMERRGDVLAKQGRETRLRICQAIASGAHKPGMISQRARASRATVKNHLRDLRAEGLVSGRYADIRLTEAGVKMFGTDDFDQYYPHGGPSLAYFEQRFAELAA